MKNRLLIATAVLSMIVFAANGNCSSSALRVNLRGFGNCDVILDGRMTGLYSGSVYFEGLRPGYHDLKVIRRSNCSYYGNRRNCRQRSCGAARASVINTTIYLRPGSFSTASVDGYGGVILMDRPSCSVQDDFNDGYFVENHCGTPTPWDMEGAVAQPAFNTDVLITDIELDQIISAASSRPFSSTRMEIVRSATKGRMMTVAQVRRLMNLFDFESDRLALAKFTYDKTIDHERYYGLFDAFAFDSSIDELQRFMEANS